MNSYDINFDHIAPFTKTIAILENQGVKLKENYELLKIKKEKMIDSFVEKYDISSKNDYKKIRLAKGFSLPKKEKLKQLENISGEFTEKINNLFLDYKNFDSKYLEKIKLNTTKNINSFCKKNKINDKILNLFLDLINLILNILKLIIDNIFISTYDMKNNNNTFNFTINKVTIIKSILLFISIIGFIILLFKGEKGLSIMSLLLGILGIYFSFDISNLQKRFDSLEQLIKDTNWLHERQHIELLYELNKLDEISFKAKLDTVDKKYGK